MCATVSGDVSLAVCRALRRVAAMAVMVVLAAPMAVAAVASALAPALPGSMGGGAPAAVGMLAVLVSRAWVGVVAAECGVAASPAVCARSVAHTS